MYTSYLSTYSVTWKESVSEPCSITTEVPQGSFLGPTLFFINIANSVESAARTAKNLGVWHWMTSGPSLQTLLQSTPADQVDNVCSSLRRQFRFWSRVSSSHVWTTMTPFWLVFLHVPLNLCSSSKLPGLCSTSPTHITPFLCTLQWCTTVSCSNLIQVNGNCQLWWEGNRPIIHPGHSQTIHLSPSTSLCNCHFEEARIPLNKIPVICSPGCPRYS